MVEAVMMMGGLGLLVGVGLAAASKIFYVYVDPLILSIDEVLPGANCGGCGKPGCAANAEAIAAGQASPNSCVAAGPEVAEAIAAIMGVSVEAQEPDIARPGCTYGTQQADLKFIYNGLNDCRAAAFLSGGMKVCSIGCLGLGTCARACPFDAIRMGADGLPVIDEKRCTGCGTCERVCPKHIITLSSVTRRIIREYTTDECTTPCQRACPAGIDIREYIRQITRGDCEAAVQVIKERNPFPTVIGRICPRPCELECRRKYVDEPVAINFLKRYAADYEYELSREKRILPYRAPATGRTLAVIGGGVQGLSTAFFAARLGHTATVYEASDAPGGLLRSAIAAYRLPHTILDWDIDGIRAMGVEIRTGQALGRDLTIPALLRDGAAAVFLATGGWDSRLSHTTEPALEQPIPGTRLLIDYLRDRDAACSDKVVIAGGGRSALEAARACRTRGASHVTLLLRESPEALDIAPADSEALSAEGVSIRFTTAAARLFGRENDLVAVEAVDLTSGTTERLATGAFVVAAGRFPELIFTRLETEQNDNDAPEGGDLLWQAVERTKQPADREAVGFFADSDAKSDYSAAIKAIAAGRRAAAAIHKLMYGLPLDLPADVVTPQACLQNVYAVAGVNAAARQIMPLSSPPEQAAGQELEKGFDPAVARKEADRCLQCGLICYRHDPQGLAAPVGPPTALIQ